MYRLSIYCLIKQCDIQGFRLYQFLLLLMLYFNKQLPSLYSLLNPIKLLLIYYIMSRPDNEIAIFCNSTVETKLQGFIFQLSPFFKNLFKPYDFYIIINPRKCNSLLNHCLYLFINWFIFLMWHLLFDRTLVPPHTKFQ